jgi:hypothetical protein
MQQNVLLSMVVPTTLHSLPATPMTQSLSQNHVKVTMLIKMVQFVSAQMNPLAFMYLALIAICMVATIQGKRVNSLAGPTNMAKHVQPIGARW